MKFFRLVTRSLILLLIALFSALTTMRFAIHGREVRVPNVKSMTVLQAQETANGNGLVVFVEEKFYSPSVPAGEIISQVPPANSKVRRGWRVRVAESLGPQRVTIPDLIGQTERAATLNLRQRGLDLATVAGVAISNATSDHVIAQVPPPSAAEVSSPKVSILLAEEPPAPEYVMPDFVGRQLADAKQKIARAGLQISNVSAVQSSAAHVLALPGTAVAPALIAPPTSGRISSQSPPPGSRVTAETQIKLEVSQ